MSLVCALREFTFHYVSIKSLCPLRQYPCQHHLHSTMYLLNHYDRYENLETTRTFTFHYVSIKSGGEKIEKSILSSFTFHYVSIKSVCRYWTHFWFLHLHSTMYLLNLLSVSVAFDLNFDLHSTMYLLNRNVTRWKHSILKFTFHYVSIKSISQVLHWLYFLHLHSTMYLLNQNTFPFRFFVSLLFTFHYVSIKSVHRMYDYKQEFSFTFHYVSIKSQGERGQTC